MSKRDASDGWLPLALLAGASAAATAAALVLSRSDEPAPTVGAEKLQWLGGATRENTDALAYLFASENDNASLLVWTLQALCANNFARQLSRTHTPITSIADMLKSGIDALKKRQYQLGWGKQYDKALKLTRWASTQRGKQPLSVAWPKFELAERLLQGRIQLTELRGRRGETMPPAAEWTRLNAILEYENFGEIVQRQAGTGAETNPDKVILHWGKARLICAVEGLRFYATGG